MLQMVSEQNLSNRILWHWVKERYRNKPRQNLNESDREDKISKKNLKKVKVTVYINKVYLHFLWLSYKNFIVKRA